MLDYNVRLVMECVPADADVDWLDWMQLLSLTAHLNVIQNEQCIQHCIDLRNTLRSINDAYILEYRLGILMLICEKNINNLQIKELLRTV